jgi:cytochrome c biogenesis protein CcmG/thiol:disulfide interchange protein DsbE
VRRAVLFAIPAVAAIVVVAVVLTGDGPKSGVASISGEMPSIEGRALAGRSLTAEDLQGHVVVVNFWNEFCIPCRREQPELTKAWERLRSSGVTFVGVNYVGQNWPDDRDAAREYLHDFKVTYPTVLDPDSEIAEAFGIQGIPTTIIVGKSGHLRWKILGGVKPGQLDRLMKPLL